MSDGDISPAVRKAMAAFHGGRELLARNAALEAEVARLLARNAAIEAEVARLLARIAAIKTEVTRLKTATNPTPEESET